MEVNCMKIKWFGQSCFRFDSDNGISIITDPFDETLGYDLPHEKANIVTVSHQHYDHNYVDAIYGDPKIIKKTGRYNIDGIIINGIQSYHDECCGSKRGTNIIYTFDIDEIRICHLGDLGHILTKEQIENIGKVDILLIPVGGTYTLDASTAAKVVSQLNPNGIIPMHYKTSKISLPIDPVDNFTSIMQKGTKVKRNYIEVRKDGLGRDQQLVILDYE